MSQYPSALRRRAKCGGLAARGETELGDITCCVESDVPFSVSIEKRTLHARRIHISPLHHDSAGLKDLVLIFFDPARPGRNIVYDYSDFLAS
jgi:hypothetical protein